MKKGVAIGGLILVTVIWGGGFVASDMALESMKPFQIMMVRFLLASVLMGLVSMGQRKKETKVEDRTGAIKAGILMGITLFAGFLCSGRPIFRLRPRDGSASYISL